MSFTLFQELWIKAAAATVCQSVDAIYYRCIGTTKSPTYNNLAISKKKTQRQIHHHTYMTHWLTRISQICLALWVSVKYMTYFNELYSLYTIPQYDLQLRNITYQLRLASSMVNYNNQLWPTKNSISLIKCSQTRCVQESWHVSTALFNLYTPITIYRSKLTRWTGSYWKKFQSLDYRKIFPQELINFAQIVHDAHVIRVWTPIAETKNPHRALIQSIFVYGLSLVFIWYLIFDIIIILW